MAGLSSGASVYEHKCMKHQYYSQLRKTVAATLLGTAPAQPVSAHPGRLPHQGECQADSLAFIPSLPVSLSICLSCCKCIQFKFL